MAEYCRDAKDFLNIQITPESAVVGRYQAEDVQTPWSASDVPSSHSSAVYICAWDATGGLQPETTFSASYVNDEGNAPTNRIETFPATGSYNVWVEVFGGSGASAVAHGITVGSASTANVSSSTTEDTGVWREVPGGPYTVKNTDAIKLSYLNPNGFVHAIRAICLKTDSGAPTVTTTGNDGDQTANVFNYDPTGQNLIDQAQFLLLDSAATVWPESLLTTFLNQIQTDFARRTKCVVAESSSSLASGGTGVVSLPTDCVGIDKVDSVTVGTSRVVEAGSWGMDRFDPDWQARTDSVITHYTRDRQAVKQIRTYPIIDQNDTLTFRYFQEPASLASIGAKSGLPRWTHHYLMFGLTALAADTEEDLRDNVKAEHCKLRYEQAISIVRELTGESDEGGGLLRSGKRDERV
jgi:hypothetical protein